MTVLEKMENIGGPPPKFWENDLEIGLERIFSQIEHNGFVNDWISRLTGRQIDMLCWIHDIDEDGSVMRKREALRQSHDELLPYLLVDQFARNKSKVEIIDFAQGVLDDWILDSCQKNEEEFDTTALLFGIFHKKWSDLRIIFHLDKIHKSGFARMKLHDQVRSPAQSFSEFLQPDIIEKLLMDFDKTKRDKKKSEFKCIIPYYSNQLVFIRRQERPAYILQGQDIKHGYRPEWIILDFDGSAKHLRISSVSVSVPLEIANRIATKYFGKECEYKNESHITFAKQIDRFLKIASAEDSREISLVELTASNSPLEGAPKIMISDPLSKSIGGALAHFEQTIGNIQDEKEKIDSIKVCYNKKRITVKFEEVEGTKDEFIVRYSDHRLNALERRRFEDYIRNTHGITILSTEKRFKR